MVISFKRTPTKVPPLTLNKTFIDRVSTFKLLGDLLTDKLSWDENTNALLAKSAPRIYYLKQLWRSNMQDVDLLVFLRPSFTLS